MANNSNKRVLSDIDAVSNEAPNEALNEPINVETINSSNSVDRFVIRLPKGLRDQIKELSELNHRSMNSEIVMVLEKHVQQNQLTELKDQNGTEGPLPDHEVSKRLEELKDALLDLMS